MAFFFQLPPPPVPKIFFPPSQQDITAYGQSILKSLGTALKSIVLTLQELDDNDDPEQAESQCHFIISQILALLRSAIHSPL